MVKIQNVIILLYPLKIYKNKLHENSWKILTFDLQKKKDKKKKEKKEKKSKKERNYSDDSDF